MFRNYAYITNKVKHSFILIILLQGGVGWQNSYCVYLSRRWKYSGENKFSFGRSIAEPEKTAPTAAPDKISKKKLMDIKIAESGNHDSTLRRTVLCLLQCLDLKLQDHDSWRKTTPHEPPLSNWNCLSSFVQFGYKSLSNPV